MVFVRTVDGEALGTDHAFVLAFGVDADEGGGLLMEVAIIGFDELLKDLGEVF